MSGIVSEALSEQPIPVHAASERHSEFGAVVRDAIIGFADGMTVPFALTAGLSSLGSSKLVIVGGLAELFSGSISMGLGAYLASVTDRDHYKSEEAREREEVFTKPDAEKEEVHEILAEYGISREASQEVVNCLAQNIDQWIRVCARLFVPFARRKVSRRCTVYDGL
jgi:VIT1/CCC1 family predicted Fe2+/Mn2+ transporter